MSEQKNQIAAEAAHKFLVFRAKAAQTEEQLTQDIKTAIEKATVELREEVRVMTNQCVQLRQESRAAQESDQKPVVIDGECSHCGYPVSECECVGSGAGGAAQSGEGWRPFSEQPKVDDWGPLKLIQIYDTQYKFTFNMSLSSFVAMRPEWVWRTIIPPDDECRVNPVSSRMCERGTKSCEVHHSKKS